MNKNKRLWSGKLFPCGSPLGGVAQGREGVL
jgi:hypothetical protein